MHRKVVFEMVADIGFIGAGNMAEALMRGIIGAGISSKEGVIASEIFDPRREYMGKELGVRVTSDNAKVAREARTLVLAVKPQHMGSVLKGMKDSLTPDHLVISIAAGVTIDALESSMPKGVRVVRVMPNQPCMVGAAASGFALGSRATADDSATVQRILDSVGVAFPVPEMLLDAVTGLSGSGPAFMYIIIEAMADGGVAEGLSRDVAIRLAAQTMLGAAKTILDTGTHPAQMKDMVSSPAGTTMAGIEAMEGYAVRAGMIAAVRSTAKRSRELGQD